MLRFGCQSYTWEMLGDRWQGTTKALLHHIAGAGYAGVELSRHMLGEFTGRPDALRSALDELGLTLCALAYAPASGFADPAAAAREIEGARKLIDYLERFPGAKLCLGGAASPDRTDYRMKIEHAISQYVTVAHLGLEAGIDVLFHPHSHGGSLIETADEYAYVLRRTEGTPLGFNPDTGHIMRSGSADLLGFCRRYLHRIRHIHCKDVDETGGWTLMGQGRCDFDALFTLLIRYGYAGWVVCEDESPLAARDPLEAISRNRAFVADWSGA